MTKFKVNVPCNYVQGYLRYGHFEGIVEADSKEDAIEKIKDYVTGYLELEIDDYEVNDYDADYDNIKISEIKDEKEVINE